MLTPFSPHSSPRCDSTLAKPSTPEPIPPLLTSPGRTPGGPQAKLSELRELLDQDNKELPMKLAAGGREKEGLVPGRWSQGAGEAGDRRASFLLRPMGGQVAPAKSLFEETHGPFSWPRVPQLGGGRRTLPVTLRRRD